MSGSSSRKIERFVADGQSSIKILRTILFSSTTADTLDLKAGSDSGDTLLTYTVAANGTTGHTFLSGVESPVGNWYVDVTTTGAPKITLIGD